MLTLHITHMMTEVYIAIINTNPKAKKMKYILVLISIMVASCQSTEEQGHAHDAQGGHIEHDKNAPPLVHHPPDFNTSPFLSTCSLRGPPILG